MRRPGRRSALASERGGIARSQFSVLLTATLCSNFSASRRPSDRQTVALGWKAIPPASPLSFLAGSLRWINGRQVVSSLAEAVSNISYITLLSGVDFWIRKFVKTAQIRERPFSIRHVRWKRKNKVRTYETCGGYSGRGIFWDPWLHWTHLVHC